MAYKVLLIPNVEPMKGWEFGGMEREEMMISGWACVHHKGSGVRIMGRCIRKLQFEVKYAT